MKRSALLALLIAWAAASAEASMLTEAHVLRAHAPEATQPQNVAVEPVTCWWRTSATAVRVGETFTVILTCSLLQTEAARAIAEESRLEPSVVQLPPFEVVGGARAGDVTTAGRRFVQFEYRLRVIAENVFASEAALPPLEITYHVESRVAGGDSLAGRDLTYALPPLTMRVLSLVPDTADDIREAPVATFTDVEGTASRGTMFRVAAGVALAVGMLMLVFALLGTIRRRWASRPPSERRLPAAAILNGVRRELASIREEVRSSGWTSDLASRALAALRIVAAYASGRPVAQRISASGDAPARGFSGEVVVSSRMRSAAAVSSAVATTEDDELGEALASFAGALYGRQGFGQGSGQTRFDARLDGALEAAVQRADRLAADRPFLERLWTR